MADIVYDVCVVGAGMIGCAAAKHLTSFQDAPRKILLIGPGEPKDRSCVDIFAAWHDEGRITRRLDGDDVWGHLAAKSIDNYRSLEMESGVPFFTEVGLMRMGPRDCDYISHLLRKAQTLELSPESLDCDGIQAHFPYIHASSNFKGIYERTKAGHISPRNLVKALKTVAVKNGCDVVNDVVSEVKVVGDLVEIQTDSGHVYRSQRVLLTTGAFTSCRKLLPVNMQPDIRLQGTTVVLIRVSEEEARRLDFMPSYVIIKSDEGNEPQREPFDVYGLPPILYPDGHYYLKISHRKAEHLPHPNTPGEITAWYQGGADPELVERIVNIFHTHFPDIQCEAVITDNCIVSKTPTQRPYVDMLTSQLGVAIGGNGYAAKSCLELGYVAARMIAEGKWNYEDLPAEVFKYHTKQH